MFKNYFKGMEGIANYPMFLLIVFFLFFVITLLYLWKADSRWINHMSEMPLHDTTNTDKESAITQNKGL